MNWLEFIASIVSSLAWPVLLLIIFFVIKRPLIKLLFNLKSLKYKDIEITMFVKEIAELTNKSKSSLSTTNLLPDSAKNRLYLLAESAPRVAILEAWLQLESTATLKLKNVPDDISKKGFISPIRMGQRLFEKKIITAAQKELFDALRVLRNKVVHIDDMMLPLNNTKDYIDLSLLLSAQIESATS